MTYVYILELEGIHDFIPTAWDLNNYRFEIHFKRLIEKCLERIPSFAGVKLTSYEIGVAAACLDSFG